MVDGAVGASAPRRRTWVGGRDMGHYRNSGPQDLGDFRAREGLSSGAAWTRDRRSRDPKRGCWRRAFFQSALEPPGRCSTLNLSDRGRSCQGEICPGRQPFRARSTLPLVLGGREGGLRKDLAIKKRNRLPLRPVEPALEHLVAVGEGSNFLGVTLGVLGLR